MHVQTIGSGPRVLLVHGSVTNSVTWAPLRALRDRLTLVLPDRPGYPPNPPLERIDPAEQAEELAELLGDGAHLLGYSYGGVISLLLAASHPERVRSLAVIEPPCFGVARGHPAVDAMVEQFAALWSETGASPAEFLRGFSAVFGEAGQVPAALPPEHEQGVRALMAEVPPWEPEIPLDALGATRFPKLVFSSASHPAYEAVCDVLERRLDAERAVLAGAGHGVHRAPGFVDRYADFLERA